ncbi:Guanine nucleotide-binding-like protein 1 [Phlyctochytrium bullatum]|nr:Guanine nucleotide-binding-like protein 1 [Phlyctochytrium bullatum]
MHRKKPFSAKQKKAQLLEKRARHRAQEEAAQDDDDNVNETLDGEDAIDNDAANPHATGRTPALTDHGEGTMNTKGTTSAGRKGGHKGGGPARGRFPTAAVAAVARQRDESTESGAVGDAEYDEDEADRESQGRLHGRPGQQPHQRKGGAKDSSSASSSRPGSAQPQQQRHRSAGPQGRARKGENGAEEKDGEDTKYLGVRTGDGGRGNRRRSTSATHGTGRHDREAAERMIEASTSAHRLVSVFAKLSPKEMEEQKRKSQQPFKRLPPESLEIGFDDLYPDSNIIDFPKRPPWSKTETKEELEAKEERAFAEWLKKTYETWKPEDLSFFEHNLEVWRQLWRVVEISDIVLFVVDSRHPILHFPPSLYDYIVNQMKKKLVLVFNKIDLVDTLTLEDWKTYFLSRFPSLHTANFSIYPREVHLDAEPPRPGELIHTQRVKASTKVARFTRSVGVATVLRACRDVELVKGAAQVDWEGMIKEEEEKQRRLEELAAAKAAMWEDVDDESGRRRRRRAQQKLKHGEENDEGGEDGGDDVDENEEEEESADAEEDAEMLTNRLGDVNGLDTDQIEGMYKIAQVQEPYSAVQYLAERVAIEKTLRLPLPERASDERNFQWSAWDICESFAISKGFLTSRAARPDVYRAANFILRMANDGRLLMAFKPPGFFARNRQALASAAVPASVEESSAYNAVGMVGHQGRKGMKKRRGNSGYDAGDEGLEEGKEKHGDVEEEDEDDKEQLGRTVNAFALLSTDD